MMDPTQQAGQGQPAPQQGGQTVCIAAKADGTFMVYPEGGQPTGEPAPDVDSALEQARQLLDGGAPGAPAQDDAEALFQQGFNKARGNPLNRGDGDHEYR
jgi:hypothetical protein